MPHPPQSRPFGVLTPLAAGLVLAAFATLPFWAGKGLVFLAGIVLVQIVFALSFNLMFGLTGLVSFGQAAFFAAGAYASAWLARSAPGLPFILSIAFGAAVGAALSFLIGLVALRRASGIYFAILTLALGQLIYTVIGKTTALGREDGLIGIARPVLDFGLFRVDLATGDRYYFLLVVAAAIISGALWWVWHGSLGRILAAIRQEPERVRFLGVDVRRHREYAFLISGTMTALAGALMAPWSQIITPMIAHWSYSALPILFCLLGGSARFWGPAVGAIVFAGLEHGTRNMTGMAELVVGGALLLVVLAMPGGILGTLARLSGRPAREGAR
ncbi:amino acid/amide ABC transporter membrane protein 2 (HAAT family) [Humitalea rosea]|uniref:Amino acid/amide ABC transporter membrane protein 2 (HAAT family) n=1 Tax=Humitalea rosea TaxID=990373 RepID=A0A2W7HYS9_9PROT|nr:branched-chain amino acid ABC transporter permease [Humitalea rosea]PZW37828.1 amino acid/amide ABC transporter membrane protein 2 (HAAT family) [Humitalea rosea]